MTHGFTCLIPAHNEAPRIAAVLRAVLHHPALAEVLVIDDGSTDGTAQIARDMGARVLQLSPNRGKTAALAAGLAQVQTSHVLLLDADLTGLTPADVGRLLAPVRTGRADVALSLRGNAPLVWRLIGVDYITGERALPMALIAPHLGDLPRLPRFGFEVFLNRLMLDAGAQVAVVAWPRVASPAKSAKRGVWAGLRADLAMLRDIFRTVDASATLAQIARLAWPNLRRGARGRT